MTAYMPRAKRDDWRTPEEALALVREVFGGEIHLDPCAAPWPHERIADTNWCDRGEFPEDGLTTPWSGQTFVNPPFGALRRWVERCVDQHRANGAEIILLIPARTDTRAWHEHVATASSVCLWRGRLTFVGAPAPAPFPVAFVYWGPRADRFRAVFGARGMVFRP